MKGQYRHFDCNWAMRRELVKTAETGTSSSEAVGAEAQTVQAWVPEQCEMEEAEDKKRKHPVVPDVTYAEQAVHSPTGTTEADSPQDPSRGKRPRVVNASPGGAAEGDRGAVHDTCESSHVLHLIDHAAGIQVKQFHTDLPESHIQGPDEASSKSAVCPAMTRVLSCRV